MQSAGTWQIEIVEIRCKITYTFIILAFACIIISQSVRSVHNNKKNKRITENKITYELHHGQFAF